MVGEEFVSKSQRLTPNDCTKVPDLAQGEPLERIAIVKRTSVCDDTELTVASENCVSQAKHGLPPIIQDLVPCCTSSAVDYVELFVIAPGVFGDCVGR